RLSLSPAASVLLSAGALDLAPLVPSRNSSSTLPPAGIGRPGVEVLCSCGPAYIDKVFLQGNGEGRSRVWARSKSSAWPDIASVLHTLPAWRVGEGNCPDRI